MSISGKSDEVVPSGSKFSFLSLLYCSVLQTGVIHGAMLQVRTVKWVKTNKQMGDGVEVTVKWNSKWT